MQPADGDGRHSAGGQHRGHRRQGDITLDGPHARQHYLGRDQDLERRGDHKGSTRRQAARTASIIVVHRSDGSGTTFIFTDYLSKVSPEWKSRGRRSMTSCRVARRHRRQGQRRRGQQCAADQERHRLRRDAYAKQTKLTTTKQPANRAGKTVAATGRCGAGSSEKRDWEGAPDST